MRKSTTAFCVAFMTATVVQADTSNGFSVKLIESSPIGCSVKKTIDMAVGSGWVYEAHVSDRDLLFSDKNSSIEIYDPEGLLTGCLDKAAWQKYSDYMASGEELLTTGANCMYSKPGTVEIGFTLGFYEIVSGDTLFDPPLVKATVAQGKVGEYTTVDLGPIGFGKLDFPTGKSCLRVVVQ